MGRHTAHGFGQKNPHLLAQGFVLRRNGRRVQRIQLAHANTPFKNNVFMISPVRANRPPSHPWRPLVQRIISMVCVFT